MKSSNIGGQAVMEGVMMMNKDRYSVAVRRPDGEIEVKVAQAADKAQGAFKSSDSARCLQLCRFDDRRHEFPYVLRFVL